MMTTALLFRHGQSAARRLPQLAIVILAEYRRAMLAASRYDDLRARHVAEPMPPGTRPGGIARAVFDAVYGR